MLNHFVHSIARAHVWSLVWLNSRGYWFPTIQVFLVNLAVKSIQNWFTCIMGFLQGLCTIVFLASCFFGCLCCRKDGCRGILRCISCRHKDRHSRRSSQSSSSSSSSWSNCWCLVSHCERMRRLICAKIGLEWNKVLKSAFWMWTQLWLPYCRIVCIIARCKNFRLQLAAKHRASINATYLLR